MGFCSLGALLALCGRLAGKPSSHQARKPVAKLLGVQRTVTFEDACLIKDEMRHVLLELALGVAQAGDCEDDVVSRIDLEDRLCSALEASRAGEQLFQLAIRPFLGRDQARDAVSQSIR